MKSRTLVLVGVILLTGIAALTYLKSYSLQLVHAVVVNAVIQKAPEEYDRSRIEEVFERRLKNALNSQEEKRQYLERLKRIFHRLEKRQRLETYELDAILQSLESH